MKTSQPGWVRKTRFEYLSGAQPWCALCCIALAFCLSCTTPRPLAPHDAGGGGEDAGALNDVITGPLVARVLPSHQDIVETDVTLDLATYRAHARILVLRDPEHEHVAMEVQGLEIDALRVDGREHVPQLEYGRLWVPAAGAPGRPIELEVDYRFRARGLAEFDGWMPDVGISFTWPLACGNLFPCMSSTADGAVYRLDVTGVPEGMTAVFPRDTRGQGPAYMAGVAVGPFEHVVLGETAAGTRVSLWRHPDWVSVEDARAGTVDLVGFFDYFERALGPYPYGAEAGVVTVNWGDDSFGGMETHPFYQAARFDFHDDEVHAHEAAHAWFGNSVRMACWEDYTLSEGTTTYLAARALQEVAGRDVWPLYLSYLTPICEGLDYNAIVMPPGCNEIDFLNDPLRSFAPYMKGACFYEEVADLLGRAVLDEHIRDFYLEHAQRAARMRDMVDFLRERAGPTHAAALDAIAVDWLETLACPEDYAARCGTHADF